MRKNAAAVAGACMADTQPPVSPGADRDLGWYILGVVLRISGYKPEISEISRSRADPRFQFCATLGPQTFGAPVSKAVMQRETWRSTGTRSAVSKKRKRAADPTNIFWNALQNNARQSHTKTAPSHNFSDWTFFYVMIPRCHGMFPSFGEQSSWPLFQL